MFRIFLLPPQKRIIQPNISAIARLRNNASLREEALGGYYVIKQVVDGEHKNGSGAEGEEGLDLHF